MSGPMETALEAWGDPLPDWIEALARACVATSQSDAAKRIGRSAGLVSQVLRRKYPGDVAGVEDAVRGAFMDATVTCPELGPIRTHICQGWRRAAGEFQNTNSQRVRMFRACHGCPRYRKGG